MIVSELITKLRQLDQDKRITVSDINGDFTIDISVVEEALDQVVICPNYTGE